CNRRLALVLALSSAAAGRFENLSAGESPVVLVTQPGIEAYSEALRGFENVFKSSAAMQVVDAGNRPALQAALAGTPRLAVAMGSDALAALETAHSETPVVLAMVLHAAGHESAIHLAGSVQLELAPAQLLDDVADLFPGKFRIGVIHNPGS